MAHKYALTSSSKIVAKSQSQLIEILSVLSTIKYVHLDSKDTVDIKILWWIRNRPIVHDKIFTIKLISNWWRERSANEIKPHGNIKWRKPYGNVRRKDLYGKFLLNEIPN